MDITAVNRNVPITPAPAVATPVENSASNRDVVQAVKALNGTDMFGENELTFQKDPQTHRMVIKIINRETQEVVMQIPPEYVVQLAEDIKLPAAAAASQTGQTGQTSQTSQRG